MKKIKGLIRYLIHFRISSPFAYNQELSRVGYGSEIRTKRGRFLQENAKREQGAKN